MKRDKITQTVKVGIFTVIGIITLTSLIFYIGSRKQAFGEKTQVSVTFQNISGLKKGNAVRFSGVVIGSVDEIKILSDSAVLVTLSIDASDGKFVKKDSKVSISTEGLLGSKYIKVLPGSPESSTINDGDRLPSIEPADMDELFNNLSESGNHFKNITGNIDQIVSRINSGNGMLGTLISDPKMGKKVNEIVNSFGATGHKASQLTSKMIETVDTLAAAGSNTVQASEALKEFTSKLNNDSSTLGKIITDTVMANDINNTILELQTTAADVKETSSSVRNSWIIKLFGKKSKKKK